MCGEKEIKEYNGSEYEIQKYQGDHENEYLISELKDGKVEGRCALYENGLLSLSWMVKNGKRINALTEYKRGKAVRKEKCGDLLNKDDHRIIENGKDELFLEISDVDTGNVIYRGEYDSEMERHGKGREYDSESGKLKYEGVWHEDKLIQIKKEFYGDEMIEYELCSSVDVLQRIPIYVGGYKIQDGDIIRNGRGCLIDRDNGTAIRECEWNNGKEVNGVNLYNGWYVEGTNDSLRYAVTGKDNKVCNAPVRAAPQIGYIRQNITSLVIAHNSSHSLTKLDLNQYKELEKIEIGDNCFENVCSFIIDGLERLESVKIGVNSFTINLNDYDNNPSRSFKVVNCPVLTTFFIDKYSFSDYGGGFEMKNLPCLRSIKIGVIESESFNFRYSSFKMEGLKSLKTISIGNFAFEESLSTIISNAPCLKSIRLGEGVFKGRWDSNCKLVMEDLPNLKSLVSYGYSFYHPHTITFTNIPSIETVDLPDSFKYVDHVTSENVSDELVSHVKNSKSCSIYYKLSYIHLYARDIQ